MNFNDRLADLRRKKGLSQEQLGYVLSNLDESNFSADMQQTAAASRMAAPASAMMQAAEASKEAAKAGRKK